MCDANFFLAVIMDEPEKKEIIRNTVDTEIISPIILPYEVGNALSAILKKNRISNSDVFELFNVFKEIPVRLKHIEIEKAIIICAKYNIMHMMLIIWNLLKD